MRLRIVGCVLLCASLAGCMRHGYDVECDLVLPPAGLFILNEGNFQYGNSTLSFYNPTMGNVENEVFVRANAMKLGDVAQSMCIHDGKAWIVVNNSHVVFAIDEATAHERGRIEGFTSPRYIHFVSDDKAYVTQLWDNRIAIVNPTRYAITGYIDIPEMDVATGSTEQMVQFGRYVICNCWSYQNKIIKIDTATDAVVARLTVGIQPVSMVADADGMLWVATDGGYDGSPYGFEQPALYRIDPETMTVVRRWNLPMGAAISHLCTNGVGDTVYWLSDDVWAMDIRAQQLPEIPVVASRGTRYFGLTVDPATSDIYVADALDYQQRGVVYRYDSDGVPVGSFYVGVNPNFFCWK